ncbi:MAG: AIR synthase-related protein [bacterium]|nr:AIR synthase-related protein [bacterium]
MKNKKSITYSQVGDNYDTKDPIKKLAQIAAKNTGKNLLQHGFSEISDSRGESAFVWNQGNVLMASVVEGLGTKNLIADAMRKIVGKTYYDVVGHDTVATIINDLITVGAKPLAVHAYWAIEDNSWLQDKERMTDLINGWKKACDISGATWGGGETATMKQIVIPNTSEFAGSAVGIISPKKNLITDKKLKIGDKILLLKSNGVNANGISLTRAIAKRLPKGYATKLSNGKMYGEALLTKTNIYAKLIQDLLKAKIDIHYISNITGHGLRKIMRARQNYTYVIEKIFEPQEIFLFIQKHANLNDYEMYQTFNMGMDYAIFLSEKYVKKAQEIVKKNKFQSINAGYVEKGERQVIIKPKNLIYKGETLDLR